MRARTLAQVFSDVGHDLSGAAKPSEAATIIVQAAKVLLGWDACYLHLYSPEGQIESVLTMDTINGQIVAVPLQTFTPDPSPLMLHVLEQGAQLINRHEPGDTDTPPVALVPFGDKDRLSACSLYVPVRRAGRALGILSIQSYTPGAYCREDLQTLQALSDHCSAALNRIKTASMLLESEIKNRALLEAIVDWVFRFHNDGSLLASKAPKDFILPVSVTTADWKHLQDFLAAPVLQRFLTYTEQAIRSGEPQLFEFQHEVSSGVRYYETRLVSSDAHELLAIVRDVTERKRLEKEVLEISAAERQRIGHDLHDGLGQYVGGIAFRAKLLEQDLTEKSMPEAAQAKEIVQLLNDVMCQVQAIARGLDPIEAEASGLVPALAKLSRETRSVFRVECEFVTNCSTIHLDGTQGLHLYRIAQEAINNALKHAKPRLIEIHLDQSVHDLRLVVGNDGAQFSGVGNSATGLGLRNMHYRARIIGGTLTIGESATGQTEVCCVVPFHETKDGDHSESSKTTNH